MYEPLTEQKKRFISITPKDSELIIVNTGDETKEVLSWALPFFVPNDVYSAIEGLKSELYPPNPLGDRGPFFTREDVLKFIEKWFPKLKIVHKGR